VRQRGEAGQGAAGNSDADPLLATQRWPVSQNQRVLLLCAASRILSQVDSLVGELTFKRLRTGDVRQRGEAGECADGNSACVPLATQRWPFTQNEHVLLLVGTSSSIFVQR